MKAKSALIKHSLSRPDLDADNVNEHLDLFVNSILASINESIPELLDQLTTEAADIENEVWKDYLIFFSKNNFLFRLTLIQRIHSNGLINGTQPPL